MRASASRIAHLVWKEFVQIVRDQRTLILVLIMPVIELTIFGYVASVDLDRIETAVCDYSQTPESRAYVDRLVRSGYFQIEAGCDSVADVNALLDKGLVTVALVIPPDFAPRLKRDQPAHVLAAIDGSNSNTAMITASYLEQITLDGAKVVVFPGRAALPMPEREPLVTTEPRVWFNPELRSLKFMVPGIICVLLMESMVILTAMAIVREKENGTLEQLIVTPLRSFELIIGKAIPFIVIGYLNMIIVVLVGTFWFQVAIRGDLGLLFGLSGLFIFTCLGLGLLVSSISHTQQQAMLAGQFVLLPNLMFSGFMFPIASMPYAIQIGTYALPLRYYISIARGIFLKGVGWAELRPDAMVLLFYGLGILIVASLTFRKRVA